MNTGSVVKVHTVGGVGGGGGGGEQKPILGEEASNTNKELTKNV